MDSLFVPMEYRADETRESPGTLTGVILRYGDRANDRNEVFEQDSLHWDPVLGITITEQHDRNQQVVRAMPFVVGNEVRLSVDLPNTTRGRDVATNMRADLPLYSGLSVSFRPEKVTRRGGLRVIQRGFLARAGLVDTASYRGSTVEVREESGLTMPRRVHLWL